jgi:hypothetical protein
MIASEVIPGRDETGSSQGDRCRHATEGAAAVFERGPRDPRCGSPIPSSREEKDR